MPGNVFYVSAESNLPTNEAVALSETVAQTTPEPTTVPTPESTPVPTALPTPKPTAEPTPVPTAVPTPVPTTEPTPVPTTEPTPESTAVPTPVPTPIPTVVPTSEPTVVPTPEPMAEPIPEPTPEPMPGPTAAPNPEPTALTTTEPTAIPTPEPTIEPLFSKGYAYVNQNDVSVTGTADLRGIVITKLSRDNIVYVSDRSVISVEEPEKDWLLIHFLASDALKQGFVRARYLTPYADSEISALENNIRQSIGYSLYNGHPLPLLDCVMIENEPGSEQLPEPPLDSSPEPTSEEGIEPTPEPTASVIDESTPAPKELPAPADIATPNPELPSEPEQEATDAPLLESTNVPTDESAPEPTEDSTIAPTVSPTDEVTHEPTADSSLEPNAFPADESTPKPASEPTEVPLASPAPTDAIPEVQGSVSISIDPLFATPGDTVTLTAMVIGYESASYQWQWAAIPKPIVEKIALAEISESTKSQELSEETAIRDAAAEALAWHEEPGATGLVYRFTASPDNLNRYWRLVLTLPELSAGVMEEGARSPLFIFFTSLLIPEAKADGGTVIVTDGFASMMSTLESSETILVTSVMLNVTEVTITRDNQLTAAVLPEDATDKSLTWSSSDQAVAIVDKFGVVTPVAEGECTITAAANDSSGLTTSCAVKVKWFSYTFEGNTATLTGYTGANKSLIIPRLLDGYLVTEIGDSAFAARFDLTGSLVIPDSVLRIGNRAFDNGKFTGSLIIPDSVTSIGDYAFYVCYFFTGSLVIPDSVTSIGDGVFYGCSRLTGSLVIPDSVTSIGNYAFLDCNGFTGSLVISNNITRIGDSAFSFCSGFTGNLTIPSSVKSIGNWAFFNCYGFTGSLSIPGSVISIGDLAFYNCNGFTGRLIIPEAVRSIGSSAFSYCRNFTGSLVIPDSVTSFGANAFNDCSGFTGSLSIPNSVTTIGEGAFSQCTGLYGILSLPQTLTSIEGGTFQGCGFTGSLIIPSSVTNIGNYAFYGCRGFTGNLTIGNSVTSIGEKAFYDCSGLQGSLTIGDRVTSIGIEAFAGCVFTGSLVLPDSLEIIRDRAFLSCYGFTSSLIIPNNVMSIGHEAFYGCSGFGDTLILPSSLSSLGRKSFAYCTNIRNVYSLSKSYAMANDTFFYDQPVFYGYVSTPLQDYALANNLTFNPYGITISGVDSVPIGYSARLISEIILPPGVTETIFWSSDAPTIATIDQGGMVAGLASGEVIITAASQSFAQKYSIQIREYVPAQSLTLSDNMINITKPYALTASTLPDNATEYLLWSSSDETVATVDQNGIITPLTKGECLITAADSYSTGVSASCIVRVGYFSYVLNTSGVTVTGYSGKDTSLNIPVKLDGLPVTVIGGSAFGNRTDLTGSLTIPYGVTSIEQSAFYGCNNFNGGLTIPDSVITIDDNAFYNCSGFNALTMGESVSSIGYQAFSYCSSLAGQLILPPSITTIEASAFLNSSGIDAVYMLSKSYSLESFLSFYNSSNTFYGYPDTPLQSFAATYFKEFIPFGISILGLSTTLIDKSVRLASNAVLLPGEPETLTWASRDEGIATVDQTGLVTGVASGIVEISAASVNFTGTLTIEVRQLIPALSLSLSKDYIDITQSYTLLAFPLPKNADTALAWSSSEEQIATVDQSGTVTPLSEGECVITVTDSNSSGVYTSCTIIVRYYTYSLNGTEAVITGYVGIDKSITIPDMLDGYPVTAIADLAFVGRSDLNGSLTIGGNVRNIGALAFANSGFTGSLLIPNNVTSIAHAAFAGCKGFTGSLTIGSGITRIEDDTFLGCEYFTGNLVIPDGVTSIGNGAFNGCDAFNGSLSIGNSVTNIGSSAFFGCDELSGTLILPQSITSIHSEAFTNCIGLDKVYLLSQSYELGSNVFNGSAGIFFGYSGTPVQDYATANALLFNPYGINISGDSLLPVFGYTQLAAYAVLLPDEPNTLTWTSSDETSVTVDQAGLLTGLKPGKAVITASSTNFSADFNIEVLQLNHDMSNVTWDYTAPFTYDGTPKTVQLASLPAGVTVIGYQNNAAANAGDYIASVTLTYDTVNYEQPTIPNLEWTISSKVIDLEWNGWETRTYNGTPSDVTATAIGLIGEDNCDVSVSSGNVMDAGTHKAIADGLSNQNYSLPSKGIEQSYSINPKAIIIVWSGWETRPYNGSSSSVTATATDLMGTDSCDVAVTNGDTVNAGSHTATATALNNQNYMLPSEGLKQTYTIEPKIVELVWNGWETRPYNGVPSNVTATATGLVPDDTCSVTVIGGNEKAADTHTATAAELNNTNYMLPVAGTIQAYTITPKEVGLTWSGWEMREYDGNASSVSAKAIGLLPDDACTVTVTGGTETTAGPHIATATGLSNANYALPAKEFEKEYIITKAVYNMSSAGWDYMGPFTYNGTEKTVQVTGLPSGVTVVSYTGNTATNAGDYIASVSLAYDTANYIQPVLQNRSWMIEKSPGTITLGFSEMTITKAFPLAVTVRPENPNPSLVWSSSNPTIASVDQNGIVTPLMEGECIITVEDSNTTEIPATCAIRVKYFTYSLNGTEATITGYSGADKSLRIPGVIDGIPVIAIGRRAFSERADFTGNLIIDDGIKTIGVEAFIGCRGLAGSLIIPDSVTIIADAAFDLCSGFTGNLIIPDSVTSIGSIAFALCDGFTGSLMIGDNVRSIGSDAFTGCSGLTGDLVIPNGVTNIGSGAFYDCSGVTGSLILPRSTTTIGEQAFRGCNNLSNVYILSESYTMSGSAFWDSAPVFYGYKGTPIQSFCLSSNLTFFPFGITIAGVSTLPVFDNTQLIASTALLPGELETLNWSSSDETIAIVDQNGLVSGVALGTAAITASSDSFTADFTIEVIKADYEMTGAGWDYTSALTYDGTLKTVLVTGLPEGVTVESYSSNTATNPGTYSASVTFTYDTQNYNAPSITPLIWIIDAPSLSAPAISTAEAISATSLIITWNTTPLAEGYVLERAISISGTYSKVYEGSETTYINIGLTAGKVYYYRVRAVCTVDEKPYTSPTSAVKAGAPFAGTSVTRTETVSATGVKVTYGAAAGVTGYQVHRSDALDGAYAQVYSGTATACTNTGLVTGTAYYYKARSYKKIGTATYYSMFSAAKAAMPLAAPSAPAAAAAGSTSITVTWGTVTGAAGYQLYRSTSSTGTYTRVYSGADPAYTNTGLTAGRAYYYKVRAYASVAGTTVYGLFSGVKAGVPLAAPAISSAAAAGSTSIKVSWGSASAASGYQLYRSTSSTGTYAKVYSGTATSYTNTGLTTGRAYYYKVRAYKVIGSTTYYGPFGAVKIGVPLAAAKAPSVSAVDGSSIKVSWSAVTGAAGYQLYRSTTSTGTYTRVYSGQDRTYTDTALTSGKAYYYKVRAYAAVGDIMVYGPYGSAKAGVPLAAPAISSAAAAGSTSIKVSWGSASAASGYQLYRSVSATGTYAKVYSGTARAYTNTGLTTGRAYYYKVRAYKVIGSATNYGPYGAVKAGVPLAAAKAPSVSSFDGTSVKASWSAVTGATGYQLLRSTSATGVYASVYIGTERTFTDTALTTGTTYYYKVRAYKLAGTENCYGPYSAYKAIKSL